MLKTVLITTTSHDDVNRYLQSWFEHTLDSLPQVHKSNIRIVHLNDSQVNKNNFEKIVKENKPSLLLFHGHGDCESIMGHNNEVIVKSSSNIDTLKQSIVHSLACESGQKLGPESIKNGTFAFMGYTEEYKFMHLYGNTKDERLSDDYAILFLDPAFSAISTLMKGGSVEDAYKVSQTNLMRNLKLTINNAGLIEASSRMFHNLKYQIQLGNTKAKI